MESTSASHLVILVAVGGATCSGKTTLAKHLKNILPSDENEDDVSRGKIGRKIKRRTMIIHQDDFAPPEEQIPFNPNHPEIKDWDHPPTAIDWPLFRQALSHAKSTGRPLPGLESHDHLNVQRAIPLSQDLVETWRKRFEEMTERIEEARPEIEEITICLVDGFLLYWDQACNDLYDVRLFIRVPYETLKERREERQQYVTQTGDVWVDPPHYFDNIVYPAYVFAHASMFDGEDVEKGNVKAKWRTSTAQREGLYVFVPGTGNEGMGMMVNDSLEAVQRQLVKMSEA